MPESPTPQDANGIVFYANPGRLRAIATAYAANREVLSRQPAELDACLAFMKYSDTSCGQITLDPEDQALANDMNMFLADMPRYTADTGGLYRAILSATQFAGLAAVGGQNFADQIEFLDAAGARDADGASYLLPDSGDYSTGQLFDIDEASGSGTGITEAKDGSALIAGFNVNSKAEYDNIRNEPGYEQWLANTVPHDGTPLTSVILNADQPGGSHGPLANWFSESNPVVQQAHADHENLYNAINGAGVCPAPAPAPAATSGPAPNPVDDENVPVISTPPPAVNGSGPAAPNTVDLNGALRPPPPTTTVPADPTPFNLLDNNTSPSPFQPLFPAGE